ncbi:phage major capsid protein [Arthrobacter castelli]|uniref:phage major capsid protein n=1 Tax=Arthrobacter castelli TaxID=271431 RepID=UPI00041CFC2C|nr:phage major capsid protein [Arthrobacter castelli]
MAISTSNVVAISPDQIEDLIVRPVEAASVAIQSSTLLPTSATVTRIPRVMADPTAGWYAENEEIGASDPTVDDIAVTPAKLAGLTVLSNESADDTDPAAASVIGDGLTRDIGRKLDAAFFGSKGSDPVQPDGLEDLTGVTAVDPGTAWANLDPFAEATSNAEGLGLNVNNFVANPADALILAQLKESDTSNKPLLAADPTSASRRLLQGVPLLVSPAVTAGTIWGLPKLRSVVVRRNDVDLKIDKSAYFTSDRTAIRAIMRVGFGFPHEAALQKITLSAA